MTGYHSFLWLSNIPCVYVCEHTHMYTHAYLIFFICLSTNGHLGFSIIWLLQIMFSWTWGCVYLFNLVLSFSSDKWPEIELLNCMIVVFLIFWGNLILSSVETVPIYISTNSMQGFFSPYPCQYFLFLVFWIVAILAHEVIISLCF